MAAINLLKELEFEGAQATPEQQEILSRYVGWGGLADTFDESKDNWKDEFAELYTALSPEEYAAEMCIRDRSASGRRRPSALCLPIPAFPSSCLLYTSRCV